MQFSADMNISYEESIHISDWILDSRPKKRPNFHTGQAEPGTRKTSCDVEIHCDARDIEDQYSTEHLPPQVKGFGGLDHLKPKRHRGRATKSDVLPSQKSDVSEKSDVTTVSDESNKSTQWKHSWLVNNSQSSGFNETKMSNLQTY